MYIFIQVLLKSSVFVLYSWHHMYWRVDKHISCHACSVEHVLVHKNVHILFPYCMVCFFFLIAGALRFNIVLLIYMFINNHKCICKNENDMWFDIYISTCSFSILNENKSIFNLYDHLWYASVLYLCQMWYSVTSMSSVT